MPTEFDALKGLAAWRTKLDQLLAAARETALKDDLSARLAMADRLTQFIIRNPPALLADPASAEYEEMDRIARQCHDALLLGAIQERVAEIMSRTAELAALRKKFEHQTTANLQSAASIRLERVRKVFESTTVAVAAMGDLKKELDRTIEAGAATADITALAAQVGGLIERLQAVRRDVGTAFPG
jgi:hypothetical protein